MAGTWRERLVEGVDRVAERTGYAVESRDRLHTLEESDRERRTLQRELDLLAYTALDYAGGAPQELTAQSRRKLAQQARVAWMKDPLAGAAVDLMNDFVFGRGLPRPKAADEQVQKVLDELWDDPDNQLILTSYTAQLCLGTDLSLQSNLFFLVFDDGEDGKVKLGLIDHDSVETVVRDPDNRLRVLYYVARETRQEWDYKTDAPKVAMRPGRQDMEVKYYEHWRNIEDAENDADDGSRDAPELAPKERIASGKVFHIAINKTTEMAFGHPVMDRLLRWYNAYNKFMDARVDIMEASAAFVMKRKVTGTKGQLEKMATQALSRRSRLGSSVEFPDAQTAPKPASILTENENVTHEDFNINTNAPAAAQDAQMLRAQVSAATRFPQSYYGDGTNTNLATATSLELPVLKAVENRQEIVEQVVRFLIDRAIERAVETGRVEEKYDAAELAKLKAATGKADPQTPSTDSAQPADATVADSQGGPAGGPPPLALTAAHENAVADEEETKRDLGYEFSMPSPLKRMMGDLVTAIMNIARTFDPNNTNPELSRVLLTVALGEGLELEDPAGAVEKIFPEGYVDPALAASQQPAPDPSSPFGEFAPNGGGNGTPSGGNGAAGADGQRHGADNPYGAPLKSQSPDQVAEAALDTLAPDLRKQLEERLDARDKALEDVVLDQAGRTPFGGKKRSAR